MSLKADIIQVKVKFTHPYDSHYVAGQGEGEPDIGEFTKLPNGDDLETGVMAAPHLDGKVLPYAEVWHELDPSSSSSISAWILDSVDQPITAEEGSIITTYYGKAGRFFLALRQVKRTNPETLSFSAIRQDWNADEGQWATKYNIGDVQGMFTLGEDSGADKAWKVGDKVTVGPQNEVCTVRAVGS